ncbi:hypothetical protein ERS140162_00686 [Staphylococcus schweitzeri]|nr:hypothetical protein ERS140162_00686 [Staphylococcus schweitzeri]
MNLYYMAFLIVIWLNIFLENKTIHTLTILVTTLYILNKRKRIKNDRVNDIINSIQNLIEFESGYKISGNSGVPYQTVQELRNGKIKLEDARLRTIIKLYSYYVSLKER